MVNIRNKDLPQDEVQITTDETEIIEPELEEIEAKQNGFNNTLRDKLKACEAEKREVNEEFQRAKADFLNARRRLEEERKRESQRVTIKHIESLIPLCDSFYVAIQNKETWEKVDENWRRGIEGIYSQLQNILTTNQVYSINPLNKEFNPHQHEALSTIPVEDMSMHDMVMGVIQMGYEIKRSDDTTELIRPARVVIGVYEKN